MKEECQVIESGLNCHSSVKYDNIFSDRHRKPSEKRYDEFLKKYIASKWDCVPISCTLLIKLVLSFEHKSFKS